MMSVPAPSTMGISGFGRRVHRAYVFALVLVGVLSVCAFLALNGFIAKQGEAASVINVAGKQRMLSQRIAGLSQSVARETSAVALQRDRTLLDSAIRDMASAHDDLVRGNVDRNLPGIRSAAESASEELREALRGLGEERSRDLERALAEAVIDFDGREALPRIAAPCLVLAGEEEQAFIRRSLPVFTDSMPACEARIVRGQGHAWNLSAPDLFARTVRAWLTGAALPKTLSKLGEDAL